MMEKLWYQINNLSSVDSPMLVFYKDRIKENIRRMISIAGGADRIMPHVKTHKTPEIVEMHLQQGITGFKCATIAEAEMLGMTGVKEVLIAFQPVGPKIKRVRNLIEKYPATSYSVIVDNKETAGLFSKTMDNLSVTPGVYIDLNVGMDRTGIKTDEGAAELFDYCMALENIKMAGLHAYDGHLKEYDINEREASINNAFKIVYNFKAEMERKYNTKLKLIAGGTPSFPVHAKNPETICSPGTTVLWDYGSLDSFPDLDFLPAALIVSRVISKIDSDLLCLDLGHKSVAAENPLPRVRFLNAPDVIPVSQSEEHLVVKVNDGKNYKNGDVFYAFPKHICPTCALYGEVGVVLNSKVSESWKVIARERSITL